MNTLNEVLICLGNDQKLGAGYLTPVGTPVPTALQTAIALRNQFDPFTLVQNPLPNMTGRPGAPNTLLTPARIVNEAGLPPGIYLDDVSGNLDFSHGNKQPAYVLLP